MRDCGRLSAPFLSFAGLKQIGELFDGEDSLLLILAHHTHYHTIEQAEVILVFGLRSARALEGAERTMFIQNNRRRLRRGIRCPCLERCQEWQEGFGTLVQLDSMGCPIHRTDPASRGWRVLETSQHIPRKGECKLLLCAYTVGRDTQRRFIIRGASSGFPLHPGQEDRRAAWR